MIAALVGIHSEDELLPLLDGVGLDLSAFERRKEVNGGGNSDSSWFGTFYRRMERLLRKGYLFDVAVLEECVRANVGDLTFEEAYARSKRILNITVATTGKNGTPNLLNYLTAPNVVCFVPILSIDRILLTSVAYLVCCCGVQCFLICGALFTRHYLLQRRDRLDSPLASYAGCDLPSLATRQLQRRGITSLTNFRALQREPLHRFTSSTVPRSFLALGAESPR